MNNRYVIILIISISCSLFANINLTVQNKWDEKVLISANYIKNVKESKHYIEVGFNFIPSKTENYSIIEGISHNKYEFDSYYGMATGYYYGVSRRIRPGLHFGVGYERFKKYSSINGEYQENGYKDWKVTPYFGFGLQIGIASFIITNEGIGGGLNFVIGGRN